MLGRAVQSYLAVRRATGYTLKGVGLHLRSFAAFSDACGQRYVNTQTAIEWARQAPSVVNEHGDWQLSLALPVIFRLKTRAMRFLPLSSVANIDHDDLLSFFPMSRLASSYSWRPSQGTGLCAARPIAPYLHYCPVRAFGSPRPFGCD